MSISPGGIRRWVSYLPDRSAGPSGRTTGGTGTPSPAIRTASTRNTPHDSTHVLSGYDTSPHGELLVSTLTAAMHKQEAMSGHILPVIFSWHLGIQLNPVAKRATGAFDPEAFWLAWDRGSEINVDTFGPSWEFWSVIHAELAELRKRYAVPPLDPSADATLALLSA